jgi:hypothetical protein
MIAILLALSAAHACTIQNLTDVRFTVTSEQGVMRTTGQILQPRTTRRIEHGSIFLNSTTVGLSGFCTTTSQLRIVRTTNGVMLEER